MPPSKPSVDHSSRLLIRSEVLAVVRFFVTVDNPPMQERRKQVKRLQDLEDQATVQHVLVKELSRSTEAKHRQTIVELLSLMGNIETLQPLLWALIEHPDTTDEIKDAANLVLQQLGDEAAPEAYLNYLEDPEGLIHRETEHMLNVAVDNPEALIDFLDFIVSLPAQDQVQLLDSLEDDYSFSSKLSLYGPLALYQPATETTLYIIKALGQLKHPLAAYTLALLAQYPPKDAQLLPATERSLKRLQFNQVSMPTQDPQSLPPVALPTMLEGTQWANCFITLPDGLGNQGLMLIRQHDNGDQALVCLAINDQWGIIDCFGFFQVSQAECEQIMAKCYQHAIKIPISPEQAKARIQQAFLVGLTKQRPVPYEFTAWLGILSDVPVQTVDLLARCQHLAHPDWATLSQNLYQYPDLVNWFLEAGDGGDVLEIEACFVRAEHYLENETDCSRFLDSMNHLALDLSQAIVNHAPLLEVWVNRLMEVAILLDQPDTQTFAKLAATEAIKLVHVPDSERAAVAQVGFIHAFARRSLEEHLLRGDTNHSTHQSQMAALLEAWDVNS